MNGLLRTRNIFLAVLFLGLFGMAVRNVVDPDVWWHLKTGELIAQSKTVPHTDPFSYTRAGKTWIAHEWLSELFIYELFRLAGWGGAIVCFAAVVAAAFFVVFLRCAGDAYIAGILTLLGAWATAPLWGVRPQILSLLLTSVWLLILERSERNPKLLWWTLPVTIVWVNLHAGFALGIALLGLFLGGELLERLFVSRTVSESRLGALTLALLLNLLLVPLNPNGAKLYLYPIDTLRSKAMQEYIAEWASPNFHQGEYLPLLLLVLGVVVALAWSRLRIRFRDLILLMAGTFAALSSIRLIPFFVLVAVPFLARSIELRVESGAPASARNVGRQALNAAILLLMIGFIGIHTFEVVRRQPDAEARNFPSAAVAYLETHSPTTPVFNSYDWGGYLIWRLNPRMKVFVDGRADLYGEDLMRQFAGTYQLKSEGQQALAQWQIGTVIIPPTSALAAGLRAKAGWEVVYEDPIAIIFQTTRH